MKGEPRPLNILGIGDEHIHVILNERGNDYLICKWYLLYLLGRPSIAIKFGRKSSITAGGLILSLLYFGPSFEGYRLDEKAESCRQQNG